MTAILDTPSTAQVAACRDPEKLTFTTELDALAEAAAQDARHGVDTHTPYECVGHFHNTTHDTTEPKPLRTSSPRIDRAALKFAKAPLKPSTDLTAGFVVLTPKVVAQVCRWKAGQIRGNTKTNLSVKVLQRVLRDHPEIRSAVPVARRVANHVAPAPASTLGLAQWLFAGINPEDCADFFNAATRRKLTNVELLAFLIKSWNYYRSGQQVQQLSWRAGGKRPEPFPTPR